MLQIKVADFYPNFQKSAVEVAMKKVIKLFEGRLNSNNFYYERRLSIKFYARLSNDFIFARK
jgi:hypothetical protein